MATGHTWAQVARKKPSPALPTECAVNLEQYSVPVCLPPSSSCYSAFIPLPTDFKESWLLDTLSSLPSSAVGVVPHLDISVVEVCFANKEHKHAFLSSPLHTSHFTVNPVLISVV